MMTKAKLTAATFLAATTLALPATAADDFEAQSAQLAAAEGLFGGGSGKPVTFDTEAALKRGLSPEGIALAEELAAFTNALVTGLEAAGAADVTKADVEVDRYPLVRSYLEQATRYSNALARQSGNRDLAVSVICRVSPRSPACICGQIGNPRPADNVPAVRVWSNDPAALLRSLRFHPTASYATDTPSWTRPQTWRSDVCKINSYRDHAWIPARNNHLEQNYYGISPRGEPNPEVRSYSWPYPAWPAYVYWWHDRY